MKFLVVGLGSIGRRHAANLAALGEVAVTDSRADLTRETAAATGAAPFAGLDQALAWGPDAVVVAVPHAAHLPVALRAVQAGADVLVEKPLSHSRAGVDEFLAACRTLGRRAWVVCNMRFHPGPAALRRRLADIGVPRFALAHVGNDLSAMRPGADYRTLYCARRATGGGVILDAIHEIDYLCWLLGPATDVRCTAARLGDLDIDVEDFAALTLRFARGPVAQVEMDYLRPFKRRGCEIVGSEGILRWESEGKTPERCTVRLFRRDAGTWTTIEELDDLNPNRPYEDLARNFAAALRGEPTELLDAETAAAELDLALEALRQGRETL